MANTTFGKFLEKLLYLSNQKKGTLAKELGYDISYISKWINTKNLPSQKTIAEICKVTSEFVVESLNDKTRQDFEDYFEINEETLDDEALKKYIERKLKEAYLLTAEKKNINVYRGRYSEENINSITHINPSLRKQYLNNDVEIFSKKNGKLDLILSANLSHLNDDDKQAVCNMKENFIKMNNLDSISVKFLTGFDKDYGDLVSNAILLMNLVTNYPEIDVEVYNCTVAPNTVISVIKDNIFHSAIYTKDKRCLFTNMSKEERIIEEMYYSLKDMLKNRGKKIFEKVEPKKLIKDQQYTQYIMGSNLRWIIGDINQLLMPSDLFIEIANQVFKDDEEVINELHKINLFLHNITYSSNLKILIYASSMREYISTGRLNFFNIPITLTAKQVERHIEFIENLLIESDKVDIRLIESDFEDEFRTSKNTSLFLSNTHRLTKVHPNGNIRNYLMIKDYEFQTMCDELFDILWDKNNKIVSSNKEDVLERISKSKMYVKLINANSK